MTSPSSSSSSSSSSSPNPPEFPDPPDFAPTETPEELEEAERAVSMYDLENTWVELWNRTRGLIRSENTLMDEEQNMWFDQEKSTCMKKVDFPCVLNNVVGFLPRLSVMMPVTRCGFAAIRRCIADTRRRRIVLTDLGLLAAARGALGLLLD